MPAVAFSDHQTVTHRQIFDFNVNLAQLGVYRAIRFGLKYLQYNDS